MQPGRERKLVTAALVLGMFLAALEATAVGTALPTVVGELGGVARYSWVFSAYLLAATVTVPIYGKLADLYGRRRLYVIAVAIFVGGSALSGAAQSLEQLILFRAIQGIGAGGVMPLTVTLIGDIYTLEERGRMQGLFSGVWGISSLVGPAVGGLVTDLIAWRWVFYFNVPFGIASAVLLRVYLGEEPQGGNRRLDLVGTAALMVGLVLLLFAILEGSSVWGWFGPQTLALLACSALASAFFLRHQTRTPEPVLPLDLFRNPVIAVASVTSVIIGVLLFTTSAFVPMFTQGVLGGTALDAGATLAPMSIGWPIASVVAGKLLLRVGYRWLGIIGCTLTVVGCLLLVGADVETGRAGLMLATFVIGVGLGFVSTPYLVAVQNAVPWDRRGVATSSIQFFRTIGGATGIAALGAMLNGSLRATLGAEADASAALDPGVRAELAPFALSGLTTALGNSLHLVYVAIAFLAAAGLVTSLLFPGGTAASHAYQTPDTSEPVTEER